MRVPTALQFIWKYKGPRIAKAVLKNNLEELLLTEIKAYSAATVIRLVWYGCRVHRLM